MSRATLDARQKDVLEPSTLLINSTVEFSFPLSLPFNCTEKFNLDALQPVSSDIRDEAGKRFIHHVDGDHQRCRDLLHFILSLRQAFLRPILFQERVLIRRGVRSECDPPEL